MSEQSVLGNLVTAASVIGAAGLTGFITYRLGRWNLRKDLELELRREKHDAFKKLWALSEPLAKHGRTEPVTPAVIARVSQNLRKWYFEEGGMFLSDTSRERYLAFQESLESAMNSQAKGTEEAEVSQESFEAVRKKGSELRAALRASFSGFPQM